MAMSAIDAIAKPIDAKPRPSGTTVISTTSSGPTSVDFQAARRRTLLSVGLKASAPRRWTDTINCRPAAGLRRAMIVESRRRRFGSRTGSPRTWPTTLAVTTRVMCSPVKRKG